jgi:hypothetical protein
MRFSTVVAVSAAALASSAAALPTPAPQGSGAATPSTSSTQSKPATPAPATAHKPVGKLTQQPKKLSDSERGQVDISTARTDYAKAQKEFKQAQDDLAAARKMRTQAMGELGLGKMDAGLGSTSGHRHRTHKTAAKPLSPTTSAQRTSQPAQLTAEKGSVNVDSSLKTRDLDVEDLLDSLAARDLFDGDDELFVRTPGSHSTPVHTTSSKSTTSKTAQTPKKPTGEQRGRADLTTARNDYTKSQKEFKQAQSDLAASRKMEKQGLSEYGLGGLKQRDLDIEDVLESLAARGFFDEDDELFVRTPGSHSTPVHTTSSKSTTSKTAQTPKKPTSEQRGRADLTTARNDYTKSQKEFKHAQSDLAASRKMEKQGLSEYGLGGLKQRDLDVEDILESLAARGFFDEEDDLFVRTPGSSTPVRSTSSKSTTSKTAQTPKKPTSEQRGRADLTTARNDYTKSQKEFKQAQSDLAASRKMEKQGLSEYGLGGLKQRDLDVEDILESLAARGFFDEEDDLFVRTPGSSTPIRSTSSKSTTSKTAQTPKKPTAEQRGRADLTTARNDYTKPSGALASAQAFTRLITFILQVDGAKRLSGRPQDQALLYLWSLDSSPLRRRFAFGGWWGSPCGVIFLYLPYFRYYVALTVWSNHDSLHSLGAVEHVTEEDVDQT